MSLVIHTQGADYAQLDDLRNVPLPAETESYTPVSHYDLAVNLAEIGRELLKDYTFCKAQYGLARHGNQLFGVHMYQNGSAEMGLSVGFRNSYDKSMSVGICIGASVFVCDNLAFTGEITVMRKHTVNVWSDLEEMMITTVYKSQHNFLRIVEDARRMKTVAISNEQAFALMGRLFGHNVMTPRLLPVFRREWLKPQYPDFEPRNLWSLYNAGTEALKGCPPNRILEKHLKLHRMLAMPGKEVL